MLSTLILAMLGASCASSRAETATKVAPTLLVTPTVAKEGDIVTILGSGFTTNTETLLYINMHPAEKAHATQSVDIGITSLCEPVGIAMSTTGRIIVNEFGAFGVTFKLNRITKLAGIGAYTLKATNVNGDILATAPLIVSKE